MLSSIQRSLSDLTGLSYVDTLALTASFLHGWPVERARTLANEPVPFFSSVRIQRINDLARQIGQKVADPLPHPLPGAPTDAFARASQLAAAPLGGLGPYRLGEDGRLYLAAKSEHYQLSLGHQFEGYQLIDRARQLGVVNATHNNTRGSITRRLERELVRSVNGLNPEDESSLEKILALREPKVLNRVLNLETGSLAVEAGVKMMLARFYRLEPQLPAPVHAGKIPVFLVLGDHAGGLTANYHGTTLLTQVFRGLWPELREKADQARLFHVVPVRINDLEDFAAKIAYYNQGDYRTAGFLHEIILMNYGGIRLEEDFLKGAYTLCAASATPTLVDEIQSCMWYPGMYLFRLYGLAPDFVILGKGFPGGEYPASKVITTAEMDILTQFGALVTNGQEELASLAYLVTMAFAKANEAAIDQLGQAFMTDLHDLSSRYPDKIKKVEGLGLLGALHFPSLGQAKSFTDAMNQAGIDTSAQLYKPNCPPAVLVKPPLVMTESVLDQLVQKMGGAIQCL